jgi:hypothetical protein
VLELPRIQRHRAHADIWRNHRKPRDQGRKESDHADVGQEQAEQAI